MKWLKKNKIKVITISLILVILICTGLVIFLTLPHIELNGEDSLVINLDSKYKELGATAFYLGEDVSDSVKVEGKVDVHKLGTYKLTYILSKGLVKKQVFRTVTVKDIEAPVITLEGDEEVNVCPNTKFKELGFKALDNVDGDVTDKVETEEKEDMIIYTVKDKEGNVGKIERKIVYKDSENPKIELSGGDSYTTYLGNKYTDPGYNVTDNCSQDLKSKVKVTNNVNMNQTGTYSVTYEVSDEAGNTTSVKRTVKVIQRPVQAKGGTIYLTFDDGPQNGTTNKILDILKEEGVKATFFVTSSGPDSLIKREADEGHTVALHTATHDYAKVYSSVTNYFNDLKIVHDRVQRITGQDARIIRFPGGSSNTVSCSYSKNIMSTLTSEVLNRGYYYHDWNVDSNDAGGSNTASAVYNNVIRGLSSSRVNMVLMHDVKPQTRDALRDIIRYAKNNGFTFATITTSTAMVRHGVNKCK